MDHKAPEAFRTISEVADELDVPQHVLRFWETRFHEIRPMKRGGGRRYYRPDDVDLLRGIRHLLYGEGYTIRGVQRILSEQGQKFVQAVWQSGAPQPPHLAGDADLDVETDETVPEAPPPEERGIRGRLSSLIGRDLNQRSPDERPDPPLRSAPVPRVDPPDYVPEPPQAAPQVFAPVPIPAPLLTPHSNGLPREDLRKLQAALHELGECKKLLAAVSGVRSA